LPEEIRTSSRENFEKVGIEVTPRAGGRFSVRLDEQTFQKGAELLVEIVKQGMVVEA
jgi:hypothetical protein